MRRFSRSVSLLAVIRSSFLLIHDISSPQSPQRNPAPIRGRRSSARYPVPWRPHAHEEPCVNGCNSSTGATSSACTRNREPSLRVRLHGQRPHRRGRRREHHAGIRGGCATPAFTIPDDDVEVTPASRNSMPRTERQLPALGRPSSQDDDAGRGNRPSREKTVPRGRIPRHGSTLMRSDRQTGYAASHPPSTGMITPLTKLDSSLARNSMACANCSSSPCPGRFAMFSLTRL